MAIVQIAALAVFVFLIGYLAKERIVEVLPVAVSILVLGLYLLSFGNHLLWLDGISISFCCIGLFILVVKRRTVGKDFLKYCKEAIKDPATVTAFVLLLLVPILTSAKVVSWWDEYNFWGTDVKSIFYLNGFAKKYQNVAPEFGDYPPGTQMMKWWFLHLSPDHFREGLMFSGYYFLNLVFLLPLLKSIKKWNPVQMCLMGIGVWLLPSTVEAFGYDGSCADLTMAVVYGAFLVAVVEHREEKKWFSYGREALYLSLLILCKNVAFLWTSFGLLFMLLYRFFVRKDLKLQPGILSVILMPVLTEGSWLLFCLMNRRVAKLTGTALKMATGSVGVPDMQTDMLKSYVRAFLSYPLHRYETIAIDLSPLAFFVLLIIGIIVLSKVNVIAPKFAHFLLIFLPISGLLFYGINLGSHLTIFATEAQYLDPFAMVSSIERYGAPFTLGSLYLIGHLMMEHQEWKLPTVLRKNKWLTQNMGILLCLLFIFLTADYQSAYRGLISYRAITEGLLTERKAILDEGTDTFIERTKELSDKGGRVLYLRDSSDVSWVRNTYLSYEASPVSVMYGNVNTSTMTAEDVNRMLKEAHAGYLYVDELQGESQILDSMTATKQFEYSTLYKLEENETGIILVRE